MSKTRRSYTQVPKRTKKAVALRAYHKRKRELNSTNNSSVVDTVNTAPAGFNSRVELDELVLSANLGYTAVDENSDSDSSTLGDYYEIIKDPNPPKSMSDLLTGRRIVNVAHLLKEYEQVVLHQTRCTTGKMVFKKEYRRDPNIKEEKFFEVNEALVWGSMSVGIGHSQTEEMLSVLNIPSPTFRTFQRYSLDIKQTWQQHLYKNMEKAGQEEKEIAISKGDLTSDGIPYITVIGDGGWCKRSYGHSYSSASGVAVLIGAATKKPLFVGVRNKFCAMCSYYENKNEPIKSHECFRNFQGPSTAMEKDIILQGFCSSIEQHGLMYKYYIEGRRLLKAGGSIERLVTGVRMAIKEAGKMSQGRGEKLKNDILNAPYHVFGEHTNCSDTFCKRKNTDEVNNISELMKYNILDEIKKILDIIVRKADRVAFNETTNQAERFMSLVAKFVGGKRVNYTKRGSYTTRVYGAALSHYCGPDWHLSSWSKNKKRFPGLQFTSVINRRKRVSLKRKFQNKPSFNKKKLVHVGSDQFYASRSDVEPDVSSEELKKRMDEFLENLKRKVSCVEDQEKIQNMTQDQSRSSDWKDLRKTMLTASYFGDVMCRRMSTHCHCLVKRMLYPKDINTREVIYGRMKENEAVDAFIAEMKIDSNLVKPCGLFIDIDHPFLGATPDRLLGDNGIIEIKCLPSLIGVPNPFKNPPKTKSVCFVWEDNMLKLKRKHKYFFQIQGQLNIAKKDFCYLVLYIDEKTELGMIRIDRDESLWRNEIIPKLQAFYLSSMLPEIVDSRINRGLKIRDMCKDSPDDEPVIAPL